MCPPALPHTALLLSIRSTPAHHHRRFVRDELLGRYQRGSGSMPVAAVDIGQSSYAGKGEEASNGRACSWNLLARSGVEV
ncbi:hypothetical protein M430DRAFT_32867, partial [Amorphotheca resinae ATCC 22711]